MRNFQNVLIILTLTAAPGVAWGGGESAKSRFFAAYSEYSSRLEQFYRNIDMTEEVSGNLAERYYGGEMTFRWRSAGKKYRDDTINKRGVIALSIMSRGDVNCRIRAGGANTKLADVTADQKYALTEIHEGDSNRLLGLLRTGPPRLAFSPYCTYEFSILEVVKQDQIDVTSFDDSKPGFAILKYQNHRANQIIWDEELVFDKERCWALLSDRKPKRLTKIEYGDSVTGVPLVKQLTKWELDKPVYTSVVKEIKPGPVPDSVFTLADFGLPEIPPRKKPGFPVFATLGLSGLVVAIVVGWLIRRRSVSKVGAT